MARPKTGERRKTAQPLKIDRLPEPVREAIQFLRNSKGKTWDQIEELSAAPYDKDWAKKPGAGFIDWTTVDPEVLDAFPGLKLPRTTLQRWHDIRIEQVRSQVLKESATARAFAEKFVGRDVDDVNGAVLNALRDEIFGAMESVSTGNRAAFIQMLGDLTLAMTRIQRVEIMKRKVAVDEKAVQMKLDAIKQKAAEVIHAVEGEATGATPVSREAMLQTVREIYGVA